MKGRRTSIRLLLVLVLAAQLAVFAPITNARGIRTSRCTGTLTLTRGTESLVRAISFIAIGTITSFNLSYSAVIHGVTYSASAQGTCVPN
jgi:hypothetical protein